MCLMRCVFPLLLRLNAPADRKSRIIQPRINDHVETKKYDGVQSSIAAMKGLPCAGRHDRNRPHGRLFMVLASFLIVMRMAWVGVATASVQCVNLQSCNQTKEQTENFDADRPMWVLKAELRIRQSQRRRLISILNQFAEMRKNQRLVIELGNQGPDGSHLANQSGETLDAIGAPPELAQLLAVEDRIRRLRHLRKIVLAKQAARRYEKKLQAARNPTRTILLRTAKVYGSWVGLCVAAKTGRRISHALRAGDEPWDGVNAWLRGFGDRVDKCHMDLQNDIQPRLAFFQPVIDYFWQALVWRGLQRRMLASKAREIREASETHVPDVALEDGPSHVGSWDRVINARNILILTMF